MIMTMGRRGTKTLINRKQCRLLLLELMEKRMPGKFTRVDSAVYALLEGLVRSRCVAITQRHPSQGRTIRGDI